jgi:hypothetical protein
MKESIVGAMKSARSLLPHRSNSVIQDWISKGIVEASSSKGTGDPYQFTFYQLLDLMVVDQLSLLGVFQKPYRGLNIIDPKVDGGNVYEVFEYVPLEEDEAKIIPPTRSRQNAISFYKKYLCRVIITISLKRMKPPLDDNLLEKKQTKTEAARSKVGMLYYNINYFAEDPKLYTFREGFEVSGDPYQIIIEEVGSWRRGKMATKEPTLCMISVDLLRKHIQEQLGLYYEPIDYWASDREEMKELIRKG